MRNLLLSTTLSLLLPLNFAFLYQPVNYREIFFSVENSLNVDIISTVVTDVDPFDWVDPRGPLLEFQDLQIPAQATVNIRVKCNKDVSWLPFTVTHVFSNGIRAKFRYYLNVATAHWTSEVLEGDRDVVVRLEDRVYDAISAYLTVK